MDKWIDGKDVLRRLGKKDFEIFDLLASGKLQPYSSVTGEKFKWDDFDRHNTPLAYDKMKYFESYLFLKIDIETFEMANGKETTTQPEIQHDLTAKRESSDSIDIKMQQARIKGGKAGKRNMAIMEAVKQFISLHPKLTTAPEIGLNFTKKCKPSKPLEVKVDSITYEVYSDGGKIYSTSFSRNKGKYHDKSIAYSTFQAVYISQAKKEIEPSKSSIV